MDVLVQDRASPYTITVVDTAAQVETEFKRGKTKAVQIRRARYYRRIYYRRTRGGLEAFNTKEVLS